MQPASLDAAADGTANSSPTIRTVNFEPASPRAGDKVHAVVEGSDADGDRLSYTFNWSVNGDRQAQQGSAIDLSRARKGERLSVTVVASDGRASSEPFEASTRVRNRAPQLTGVRLESSSAISADSEVTARPSGKDLDGDEISYRYVWWVNDRAVAESGPKLSTSGLRRGDVLRVRAFATDGQDESNSVDSEQVALGNAPPVIVSQPSGADEDGTFRYQVRAVDADGDRLKISLTKGPRGMVMSSSDGLLVWRPGPDQGGTHVIDIAVNDANGAGTTQRFSIDVDPSAAAPPPAARSRGER
jgi:hypothetical protein